MRRVPRLYASHEPMCSAAAEGFVCVGWGRLLTAVARFTAQICLAAFLSFLVCWNPGAAPDAENTQQTA